MWSACFCTFIQEKVFAVDINGPTEYLITQMHAFLANLFQNSLWERHART